MKGKMKTSSIQLPEDIWDYLERGAKIEGRSVSAQVRKYITYGLKKMILERIENTTIDSLSRAPFGFIEELCNYLSVYKDYTIYTPGSRPDKSITKDSIKKELMHYFIDNPDVFKEALTTLKYILITQEDVNIVRLWSDEPGKMYE